MTNRIAVIGANAFQNKLILRAKALGYETHVFAWQCGDIGEKTADFFYPISITEKDRILDVCQKIRPSAVCSIASDLAVLTVNPIARALGLPANPPECDRIATNKYEMRKAFQRAGVPTPAFMKIQSPDALRTACQASWQYPVIVKPTDRSGSRAITKVTRAEDIEAAARAAMDQSFEKAAIIEEFIEGKEFSCECVSFQGEHHLLSVTEKFTTGAPHYIEIGHIEPAPLSESQLARIQEVVFHALDALHIAYGASHSEFKLKADGTVGIIEIGARMGGDCIGSDLVPLSTGYDFVKMVIDAAAGKKPDFTRSPASPFAAVRFFMRPDEADQFRALPRESLHVVEEETERGEAREVTDSGSRFGYLIATGPSYAEIRQTLFASD